MTATGSRDIGPDSRAVGRSGPVHSALRVQRVQCAGRVVHFRLSSLRVPPLQCSGKRRFPGRHGYRSGRSLYTTGRSRGRRLRCRTHQDARIHSCAAPRLPFELRLQRLEALCPLLDRTVSLLGQCMRHARCDRPGTPARMPGALELRSGHGFRVVATAGPALRMRPTSSLPVRTGVLRHLHNQRKCRLPGGSWSSVAFEAGTLACNPPARRCMLRSSIQVEARDVVSARASRHQRRGKLRDAGPSLQHRPIDPAA